MSSRHASENRFLTAPTGRLFLAQALPMMVVMSMSGLLTVVDAAFLGLLRKTAAIRAIVGLWLLRLQLTMQSVARELFWLTPSIITSTLRPRMFWP